MDFIYHEYPVDGSTACIYVLACLFGSMLLKIHERHCSSFMCCT